MLNTLKYRSKSFVKNIAIASAITYSIVYGVLIFTLRPNERMTDIILRGLYLLPVVAVFLTSVWASLNSKSYKKLWQLMAVGMFFWATGEIIFYGYVIKYGVLNVPSLTIADIFSIGYIPIILGVLFSLGRIKPPFDTEKKLFLTNVMVTATAVFILCYKFLLVPGWHLMPSMTAVQKMYAIGYPIFNWVIFVSLLLATYRFKGNRIEGWLIFFITAFGFALVANFAFYLAHNHRNPYTTWAMMGTAIFIATSAIDEVTGAIVGIIDRAQSKVSKDIADMQSFAQHPWRTLLAPFISSIVIPIVWVAYSFHGYKEEAPILGILSAIVLTLLIYRNHLLISDNAILFAKALRDSLTGLNNHRYFQEVLNKTLKKAERTRKFVSLIILDIDNFSQLNNAFGHVLGDRVLTTIGSIILSEIREDDEACRLSGDEFGIILPRTTGPQALKIAGRVKEKINDALIKAFPDKTITVTMGIGTYPTLAKDKDELLHTADGALYWAKLHGKNNILLYDPRVVESLSAEDRAQRAEEIAMVDMVRSLAKAVDARDPYTRLHSRRVSSLSKNLARFMGLDDETVNRIEIAGILHDVGKIGIPDNILNKPGRLTEAEMLTIKNHPLLSAQIIRSTSLKELVPAVKAHHERWDGNGYPLGVKGEKIPLEARILALADSFDAMTSDRPYRKGLSVEDALKEVKRCAGTQFDPQLAEYFLSMFNYYDFTAIPEESYEDQAVSL